MIINELTLACWTGCGWGRLRSGSQQTPGAGRVRWFYRSCRRSPHHPGSSLPSPALPSPQWWMVCLCYLLIHGWVRTCKISFDKLSCLWFYIKIELRCRYTGNPWECTFIVEFVEERLELVKSFVSFHLHIASTWYFCPANMKRRLATKIIWP